MANHEALQQALATELAGLETVAQALSQEHAALLGNDPEQLEQAIAHKESCIAAQLKTAQQRAKLVPEADLQSMLAGTDAGNVLNDINTLAQQCHHANLSNGALIARKQRFARTLLDAMRQQEPTTATYSGAGDTDAEHGSRSLGSI